MLMLVLGTVAILALSSLFAVERNSIASTTHYRMTRLEMHRFIDLMNDPVTVLNADGSWLAIDRFTGNRYHIDIIENAAA